MTNRKSFEIFRHLWNFFLRRQIRFFDLMNATLHIFRKFWGISVSVVSRWHLNDVTGASQRRLNGVTKGVTMTSQWHPSIPKMLQRKFHEASVALQWHLNDVIVASKNSQDVAKEISWSHSCVTGTTQWRHRRHICITMISCIEAAEELGNSGIQN